jgi:pilus assembly protein CpaB
MRAKSLILIFIALGCGLVASIGISQVVDRGGEKIAVETEAILVALADIDINAKLDAQNVRLEEWPKAKIPEGALRSLDALKDKGYARQRFYKGEPILDAKLVSDKDGPSIRIPEGKRAIPVKLEQDTVIGLISPGDRVDVLVFVRKSNEVPFTGSITILRNCIVFAVGRDIERSVDKDGKQVDAKTVSLIVSPEEAERLSIASELGKLRLSLRRPDEGNVDNEDSKTTLEELLQNKAPIVSPPADKKPEEPSNFLDVLRNAGKQPEIPVTPAQPAKPRTEMMILTPSEIKKFTWDDPKQLPIEISPIVGGGDPTAPEAKPVTPSEPDKSAEPMEPSAAEESAPPQG